VKRSTLKRRTRLKRVNTRRHGKRWTSQYGSLERVEWIASLPCALCGAPPPSVNMHVRSRGAGGKARHIIPACSVCHGLAHSAGHKTLYAERGVTEQGMLDAAAALDRAWEAR